MRSLRPTTSPINPTVAIKLTGASATDCALGYTDLSKLPQNKRLNER
jgi:hypothetical protein